MPSSQLQTELSNHTTDFFRSSQLTPSSNAITAFFLPPQLLDTQERSIQHTSQIDVDHSKIRLLPVFNRWVVLDCLPLAYPSDREDIV